ncbi:hypothetical protein [Lentzea tibetensis]|nr:hypothetical protein [Lentzea tibetensis]
MIVNTIARIAAAVILSLGAVALAAGTASADPDKDIFTPPYSATP